MDRTPTPERTACDRLSPGFGHLIRSATALERLIDKALQEEVGITHVMFEVLLRLYRDHGACTAINALDLTLTSGGMTRLLDRMEKAGLVTRGRHEGDRRVTLIRPTDKASEIFLKAVDVHVRVVERHFEAPLSTVERETLRRALARLEEVLTE
ncbi:MarR family transcriptional regulator [Herbidospora sp. NEAU-GS84]|uniref:MarR family transcriptional regulator n=1 Tax=Herbidospora solisilvae TaxID=2696284 RepID=A0A7C9NF40_9ACTN|nr:MarR family winged helix-turn-helix transcriptional regulator [Herbidospora solisilvae]NAS20732.1 MarR family transcriptional regulator [Herbidospora solisilvae]